MRKVAVLLLALALLLVISRARIISLAEDHTELQKKLAKLELRNDLLEEDSTSYNIIVGEATGYAPGDNISGICSDSNPKVTSTGVSPGEEVIAVNPEVIPYGSDLIIVGEDFYREGIAGDTGSAMRDSEYLVDLWFDSYEKAKEFGRKEVIIIWK